MIYQAGSQSGLRWNWSKQRTEPALPKISRSAKRRHRQQAAAKAIFARAAEKEAELSRKDSGLMQTAADIPLVGEAINGGWGITPEIRQFVAGKMVEHAGSIDPRAAIPAARVLVKMNEQQEQPKQADSRGVVVNVGVGVQVMPPGIQVLQDDDWYGNSARLSSAPDVAHAEGADVPGSV